MGDELIERNRGIPNLEAKNARQQNKHVQGGVYVY
jgi:hypothetical protein